LRLLCVPAIHYPALPRACGSPACCRWLLYAAFSALPFGTRPSVRLFCTSLPPHRRAARTLILISFCVRLGSISALPRTCLTYLGFYVPLFVLRVRCAACRLRTFAKPLPRSRGLLALLWFSAHWTAGESRGAAVTGLLPRLPLPFVHSCAHSRVYVYACAHAARILISLLRTDYGLFASGSAAALPLRRYRRLAGPALYKHTAHIVLFGCATLPPATLFLHCCRLLPLLPYHAPPHLPPHALRRCGYGTACLLGPFTGGYGSALHYADLIGHTNALWTAVLLVLDRIPCSSCVRITLFTGLGHGLLLRFAWLPPSCHYTCSA